jgi:hypothetical protein
MTLTELSYYSRKFLPLGIIGFLLLLIFFYLIKLILLLYTPPPKPKLTINPIFQKISPVKVKNASNSAGINFILDTIEGVPITATEAAKVFFLPQAIAKLNYRQKIYLMAKNFGFDTELTKHQLNGKIATFSDNERKLEIDITNYNFFYDYQFASQSSLFQETIIPSPKEIENKAIDFLKSVNRYPDELSLGRINILYFYYQPDLNTFSIVNNPQLANVVEVDFFRPNLGDFSFISPKFPNSHNFVLMVFYPDSFKVLRAQIKFFEKSADQVGIYPVKSGDLAWEELTKGKGIVLANPKNQKEITIKSMVFSYLDPDFYQPYLQPVYLFIGENNFAAYVPAISSDYLIQEEENQYSNQSSQ